MTGLSFWKRLIVVPALAVLAAAQPVWAHGGGAPQLVNAPAGPYRVSVWTQPDPLRAGEVHFTVAVTDPAAGAPILDAGVTVTLTPLSGSGAAISSPATHREAVNKIFYETDFELPAAGRWQVVVAVDGPRGRGQTDFEVDALPAAANRWRWWAGGLLAALLTGAVGVAIARRTRREG
ncbi:MAG: FixH family protein [Anaerolineae bacterium]